MRQSFDFEAPLDHVWALFTDPQLWTRWNTEWAGIRHVRGPFDHAGAGYTQVMRLFGRERLGTWEVVACEPKRWREVKGTLPFGIPFRGRDEFRETPLGTEVVLDLDWDTPWGLFGRLIERAVMPMMRRQFKGNAARAAALLRETSTGP